MKNFLKIFIFILIICIFWFAWYFISPIFINKKIVEENIFEKSKTLSNENEDENKNKNANQNTNSNTNLNLTNDNQSTNINNPNIPETDIKSPKVIFQGDIQKVDYEAKGKFKIYNTKDGLFLRVEDLDVINGPDLYLVFANEKKSLGLKDFVLISSLPANQGSFNVKIPDGLNPEDYKYLFIHCKRFSHTFAGGEIKKNNN